ncbi:MAG: DUF2946 family protein [Thermomonas haemolytica]
MILRSRPFHAWMARLALAAVLLVAVMPTVSRWLESRAQGLPDAVLAMCTMDGLAMKPARLLAEPGKAPAPSGAMPDDYCAYCPLLASLAPLALAVLALLLPAQPRALLPSGARPMPHAPPCLRGLGARGPPILL